MKKTLIGLALFCCGAVYADVIPALSSITLVTSGPYAGDYLWSYSVSLAPDQQVQPSGAGLSQTFPNFFTIIDFNAIPGSPTVTPAGWSGLNNVTGTTTHAFAQNQADDPTIPDVVMTYVGTAGQHGPLTFTGFGVYSTVADAILGRYEGQGTLYAPGQMADGFVQGNAGYIEIPNPNGSVTQQTPEPSTFILIGTGLMGASFVVRNRKAK